MDPTPKPPPPWRWPLVAGLIAVGALLILLWPIARALGDAVAATIQAHQDLISGGLLVFGGLVLAGLIRILYAIGRRLELGAKQAGIVRMQNQQPIDVRDVRQITLSTVQRSLELHYAVEQTRADRSAYPQLSSIHQDMHITQAAPAELPAPGAPALPMLSSSGGTALAHLRQAGHVCRSGNSLLVGYAGGQPQYIELAECGFVGVGGQPRVGKSSTTLLLITQAVLSGWHVFVADPHITKADGLLNRCKPLSGRLAKQAVQPDEIAAMVRLVDKIGRRRMQGDGDRTPVILIIDEFTNLVWRELLPPDVLAMLPSMAIEYGGVGVHGVIISHDWSKASLGGDLGAALRRAITHRLIHRMDPGNVEFLLPKGSSAQARAVAGLPTGQALYFSLDGAVTVAVPLVGDDDATTAAQGAPPRPYAPRPALTVTPPPTPARSPVPPTEPLGAPTVQEQILLLLTDRPWLTSSQVAHALGVDIQVIRTELSALLAQRRLIRRSAKQGSDKYEWSTAQPGQPLNLTPSA